IGYALVSALEAAALAGAAPSVRDEIEAAADLAESLAGEWGQEGSWAASIARELHGTVPVIAGAELAAAAAYRWKCQFNENAGLPAFCSVLPEADHNEVVGWEAAGGLGRFSYVSLEDAGGHPRNVLRAELTAEAAAAGAAPVLRVAARGTSRLERLVSLVLLGDVVSIYAAVLRGADPVDVAAIDTLKAQLASR
ncbi:MAG TPA: SIS domain-containing protein, partial [Solirubrobacter sp.]|nr:SIS domain-containing protein [Solirubrobacter sp.]